MSWVEYGIDESLGQKAVSGFVAIVFAIVFKYAFRWHIDRMVSAAPIEKP